MARIADQFVRAVQQRWTLQRALDSTTVALGIVSAICLAMLVVRPWNMVHLQVLLASAALAGAGWGVWRRPSKNAVMSEIDTQLQSHDLLTTAAHSAAGDPAFAAILLSQADAFCQRHQPGDVRLRHRSGGARVATMLLAAITLNLAWLRQASFPSPPASADRLIASAAVMQTSSTALPPQTSSSAEGHAHSSTEDSDASDRTFPQGEGSSRPSQGKRSDAGGAASAVTADAHMQPLSAVIGQDSTSRYAGDGRTTALAKDRGIVASPLTGDAIGTSSGRGSTAVEAPPAYRDLIRAYFSKSSH